MQILRFAILSLHPPVRIGGLEANIGNVTVSLSPDTKEGDKDKSLFVVAKRKLDAIPHKDEAGRVVIPVPERADCEFAIDSIGNLIAAFNACSRSTCSPTPCIALEFENDLESEFLYSSAGIESNVETHQGVRYQIPLKPELVSAVVDRLDGVTLLAEAFACGESGRYKDLARFFELAFGLPFTDIKKILYRFLDPMPYGYTKNEIGEWISKRHPIIHADLLKTKDIATASDVRDYLVRMEQAALDVLFNKSKWRDNSIARRNLWVPPAWTKSKRGDLAAIKGSSGISILLRVYDEFGIYPKNLEATVRRIKSNWYCGNDIQARRMGEAQRNPSILLRAPYRPAV
ncbi:MAG: hypothetical protein FD165_2798 [Gammaproteobacteria bacterium]|nr:MAG: hypothetical protein FD165_2798 [Gammaproteobacteria bacterium]TND02999.1 MAG: hypothetical protein FD120_2068 [Gammaproteobacteria bacterium]